VAIRISINNMDTMIPTTGEGTKVTGRVILVRISTQRETRAIMNRRHSKNRAIMNRRHGKTRAIMIRRHRTMAEAVIPDVVIAVAPVQDEVAAGAVGHHGGVGGRAAETIDTINIMKTRGNSRMIKVIMTTHHTMIKVHMLNHAHSIIYFKIH